MSTAKKVAKAIALGIAASYEPDDVAGKIKEMAEHLVDLGGNLQMWGETVDNDGYCDHAHILWELSEELEKLNSAKVV